MENESIDSKNDNNGNNEKSKKNQINTKSSFAYEKEDLVWEAVRRNEKYKQFYLGAKEEYPEDKDEDKKFVKTLKNKWQITEQNALNPDITAKELRQKIIDGAKSVNVHPYHFMFKVCAHYRIAPMNWEDWSAEEIDDNMYLVDEDSADMLLRIIRQSKKYIPIWIAPWADEDEIKTEVIKKLYSLREKYQRQYEELVDKKQIASCNIKTIDKDIETLERYDEIIKQFKTPKMIKQYGELKKKDGYYVLPISKLIKKREIIPDTIFDTIKDSDKAIESKEKIYTGAYNKAILLIKNAPNILFKPPRMKQLNKRTPANHQIPQPDVNNDSILSIERPPHHRRYKGR